MRKFPIDYIQPYDESSTVLNVIVETPKGCRVKYSYAPDKGLYLLSKVLPEGMMFPYNFGFVPGTLAADGDAIDMLILDDEPMVTNSLLKVRLLGVIEATQTERAGGKEMRNDRLIGQAITKEQPIEQRELKMEKATVNEIGMFFETYNRLYGKAFKVIGIGSPERACQLVEEAVSRYKNNGGGE